MNLRSSTEYKPFLVDRHHLQTHRLLNVDLCACILKQTIVLIDNKDLDVIAILARSQQKPAGWVDHKTARVWPNSLVSVL